MQSWLQAQGLKTYSCIAATCVRDFVDHCSTPSGRSSSVSLFFPLPRWGIKRMIFTFMIRSTLCSVLSSCYPLQKSVPIYMDRIPGLEETSLTDLAHYTFSREGVGRSVSVGRGNTFIPCIIWLHLHTDHTRLFKLGEQKWSFRGWVVALTDLSCAETLTSSFPLK